MKLKLHHKGQMVVGLAGYAGVGKNAIANELWFGQTSFAAKLKQDLKPLLDQIGLDMNKYEDKAKARALLVEWGRLARNVNPDHWIENLVLPSDDIVVITDVRYANEANAIREVGGLVIFVMRPDVGPANKEEAASFAALLKDENLRAIVNDSTLKEASEKVLVEISKHFNGVPANTKKFDEHNEIKNLDGYYHNPKFVDEIAFAKVEGDKVFAVYHGGGQGTLQGWNLDSAQQWIADGTWKRVDLDTCGTCDGVHMLGTGACTYLGKRDDIPVELDTMNFTGNRDIIADFDMAMIQQEAEEQHARETQKRFNDIAWEDNNRPSFLDRVWNWWVNN